MPKRLGGASAGKVTVGGGAKWWAAPRRATTCSTRR